jgi:hypothetical protein
MKEVKITEARSARIGDQRFFEAKVEGSSRWSRVTVKEDGTVSCAKGQIDPDDFNKLLEERKK